MSRSGSLPSKMIAMARWALMTVWMVIAGANQPDYVNPCSFWSQSYYANAKCLKLVQNPSNPEGECKIEFPRGKLALIESLEELHIFRWMADATGLSTVKFIMNDTEPIGREVCGVNCSNADNYCITCSSFSTAASTCNGCDFVNTATSALCEQAVTNPCDPFIPGAIYKDGRCFLVVEEYLTWTSAQEKCREEGAFLAEAITPDLTDYISQISQDFRTQYMWTGGSNSSQTTDSDGTFKWIASGVAVLSNNTVHWQNVIDSTDGNGTDHFYAIASSNSTGWAVMSHDVKTQFLCQKDIGNPCEMTFKGGVYSSGYCLQFYTGNFTWNSAYDYCEDVGGVMMEPQTDELQDAALMIIPQSAGPWMGSRPRATNIGLYYTWFSNGLPISSIPWEGNSSTVANTNYYMAFSNVVRGTWVAADRHTERETICQTDVSKPSRKYVVPLTKYFPETSSYVLQMTTNLRSVRVYVIIESYLDGEVVQTDFTSMTFQNALELRAWQNLKVPNGQIVEITTSHPVTFELFLRSANSMSSTFIGPSLYEPFYWSRQTEIFLSLMENEFTDVLIIPTQRRDTDVRILFQSTDKNKVDIHGMTASIQSGEFLTTLELNQLLHFVESPEHDEVFLRTSAEVSVFMDLDMTHNPGTVAKLIQLSPSAAMSKLFFTLPCFDPFCFMGCPDHEIWLVNPQSTSVQYCFASTTNTTILLKEKHFYNLTNPSPSSQLIQSKDLGYAWQVLHQCSHMEAKTACMLTPYPLWRYEYTFHIPTDYGAELKDVFVVLTLITLITDKIQLDYQSRQDLFVCNEIPASGFSSCTANVTGEIETDSLAVHYLTLDLDRHSNQRFGAHLLMSNGSDISCHPLGMTDIMMNSIFYRDLGQELSIEPCEWIDTGGGKETETPTPEPETTTSYCPTQTTQPPVIVTTAASCSCENITTAPVPTIAIPTEEEKQEIIQEIKKTLHVDAKSTSAHARKLTSADDYRPSSTTIGILGVALITLTVGALVLPDVFSIIKYFHNLWTEYDR